jgi:predicted nucleic acid-binding protein
LRRGNARLASHLDRGEVWSHPFVIGELACGNLRKREEIVTLLSALPQAPLASHEEVLSFIESNELVGSGIGWIDAHLLASTKLAKAALWTLDKRLTSIAESLNISAGTKP